MNRISTIRVKAQYKQTGKFILGMMPRRERWPTSHHRPGAASCCTIFCHAPAKNSCPFPSQLSPFASRCPRISHNHHCRYVRTCSTWVRATTMRNIACGPSDDSDDHRTIAEYVISISIGDLWHC